MGLNTGPQYAEAVAPKLVGREAPLWSFVVGFEVGRVADEGTLTSNARSGRRDVGRGEACCSHSRVLIRCVGN
jgi:hypothetical protein